jgi:hypothetical protein
VPIVIAVLALLAPASASAAPATNNAKLFFTQLAEQRLKPAPLVPTTAPSSLSPIGESIATFDQPHGYYIRLADRQRGRPHALVELLAGQYPSARAAVHAYRGGGFRPRSTVVRGKRGFLLTHKRDRALV